MDVVPKRLWTASALILLAVTSLIMAFSGSLDGAAAWANILALPVAIIGVYLTLRGPAPVAGKRDEDGADGRIASAGGSPAVTQTGYTTSGDVIQVAGDYVRDRRGSDGRGSRG
jgi:hypothetical protein